MPISRPSPRRQQLLAAAEAVVAAHGLRGLTHRAVDRQAGFAEGTCSSYFRTRRALQEGLAQHVAAHLTADVTDLSAALAPVVGDYARAAELTSGLFLRWLHELDRVVAVLELTLEATRDPELARLLAGWQRELGLVVHRVLREAGRDPDPARTETLVAALYGVLLGGLLREPTQRPAYLAASLTLLFDGLSESAHG
ncbi:MAG TPA: TetR family transcriptional regulator [Nocardioides sp.]|uniref:TetR/AcrR family transcriptional regulator n=1 Tax=Nocardioides sp. TaxID=35761 RepID=UPI002C86088F|nr:TetR family transcriptional regulator [Nocardioides sp.]HQR25747.1 TetR family transcriptional regulator [Nocardioides sp.]